MPFGGNSPGESWPWTHIVEVGLEQQFSLKYNSIVEWITCILYPTDWSLNKTLQSLHYYPGFMVFSAVAYWPTTKTKNYTGLVLPLNDALVVHYGIVRNGLMVNGWDMWLRDSISSAGSYFRFGCGLPFLRNSTKNTGDPLCVSIPQMQSKTSPCLLAKTSRFRQAWV